MQVWSEIVRLVHVEWEEPAGHLAQMPSVGRTQLGDTWTSGKPRLLHCILLSLRVDPCGNTPPSLRTLCSSKSK